MYSPHLFSSFFMGGFECSSHRRPDGRRLDMLASTGHDRLVASDYRHMLAHGMRTVRDGLRWHLIETTPGLYDWSSFLPALHAARDTGLQVIWDLCHYGWPDDIDIWTPEFVDRFGRFAAAAATLVRDETDGVPFYCPVNEISYWAWAGGDVGRMNPCTRDRGHELKQQLIRASIAAMEAVRDVDRRARFIHVEPAINVIAQPDRPQDIEAADSYRCSQWQAWDLLSGALSPELGGKPDYLDILGLNYYSSNQWYYDGGVVPMGHHSYCPFRYMLAETYHRYERPLLVAETGAEGTARPAWLHYVADEVRAALAAGVAVEGICLYPVLDYPGWENERSCNVGLLSPVPGSDERAVCGLLAEELRRQQAILEDMLKGGARRFSVVSMAG
ncbi:MAG: beta-glucosidase [Pseudomonadota bacterium]|nr:beta-glucosidase [Pseudomonadota bacterium]